ncbi:nucleoside deaminase [Flavobacteriaceae bacterium MHTCC 0001]
MIQPFDDTYFMKKALQEAEIAFEKGEVPVGAVIVIDNTIIARGHNLTETLNDVTAHAEMQAITAAANFLGGKYLKGCTLYVTLEPCQMCAGALYWSQISKIVYGARDLERGFINMKTKLHPKTKLEGGVLAEEASVLLKRFFVTKRNLN